MVNTAVVNYVCGIKPAGIL